MTCLADGFGNDGARGFPRAWLPAALAVVGCLTLTATSWARDSARAQGEPQAVPPAGSQPTRQISSMRERVYKQLAQAQEKVEAAQYAEALSMLDKLSGDELNSYERAQVFNLYAYLHHARGNTAEAISAFEKLLAQEHRDEALEAGAVYGLALLHFAREDWRQAIAQMKRWLALGQPAKPQAHELLANAHYQLEEYRQAIQQMNAAIELKRAAGASVDEQQYQLLRAAHSQLGEHDQAAAVLEQLIARFPGGKYWIQLAATYGAAGDERRQLSVLELAYLQGFLGSQPELLALAGLQLRNGLPYQAAKVLEKGFESGVLESSAENQRLLSQAWTLAREDRQAIPALTRAAAMSKDGELDIVLAQSYANLAEWEPAAKAARAGIRKGGLRRPDEAHVLLGQVLYNMEAFEEARGAFTQAQADSRSRKLAAQWLSYIDNELDRRRQLRAALQQ